MVESKVVVLGVVWVERNHPQETEPLCHPSGHNPPHLASRVARNRHSRYTN